MAIDSDQLRLTDFMDVATLQEIQDSFAAVANVKATITDADGKVLTSPVPTKEFLRRQTAIAAAAAHAAGAGVGSAEAPTREGPEFVAPIIVNNQRLGTIRMSANGSGGSRDGAATPADDERLASLSEKFNIDLKQLRSLTTALTRSEDTRPAAVQFLFLLANAIARLCYQEFQLRRRINELTAVYNVTMILSDARELKEVLQRAVRAVAEVMGVKAASIRLIDRERDEMIISAAHNLSAAYVDKGPVRISRSAIDDVALSSKGYEYVRDLATDPRTLYPAEATREGIRSMISVAMRYKGQAVGVLRVYTAEEQQFSQIQIDLLKAVAAQAAAAIENARLLQESLADEALEKQVRMAADVQQRMIPQRPPTLPGIELASVYVPCYELGGDLYDFIELPYDNVGLVVADVSGKGVPASLTMAAVRAALRAQVDNVYYLYEVINRLNAMLVRDTKPAEFVTLFYGVLDAPNRRLTYCNAGHPPALLLRDGQVSELTTDNMVLGINPDERYAQNIAHLQSGDHILLYTDGLADAMNFKEERFGRQRIIESFAKGGVSAEVVANNMLWEMRKFVGLTPRIDDVTMIVAKVK